MASALSRYSGRVIFNGVPLSGEPDLGGEKVTGQSPPTE
jgi:hypothetical protein